MKKEKKIVYPLHKMGNFCGYELYEDGSIKVAPQYSKQFANIEVQRQAVESLLFMITKHCQTLLVPIEEAKKENWRLLAEDYGLELEKAQHAFNPVTGKITIVPVKA